MELAVVKYIKEHGLEKTVSDFSLKIREYDNVVILKYDQLASKMGMREVQESRGLILDKNDWAVQAMAFLKFFNEGETNAAPIDWDSARILEKLDGSIMTLWWNKYEDKWSVSSSGTAFAEGQLADRIDVTFADLFWETLEKYNLNLGLLSRTHNYIFELCTPYNIIVTPHSESTITLIGIRNLETLEEVKYGIMITAAALLGVPVVKTFEFVNKSVQTLVDTFKNMPFSEEGYVVWDGTNRIKVKNPAYVAVHHLTTGSRYNIMGVVKTNEVDEFAAAFGERAEEVYELQKKYADLTNDLIASWFLLEKLKVKDDSKEEKKRFALKVFEVCKANNINPFSGLMFGLANGRKIEIKDYLFDMKNRDIYSILKKR